MWGDLFGGKNINFFVFVFLGEEGGVGLKSAVFTTLLRRENVIFQFHFLSVDGIDGCPNIRAISLKFLLFCRFDFDPKISTKCIYSVYHLLFLFKLPYGSSILKGELNFIYQSNNIIFKLNMP